MADGFKQDVDSGILMHRLRLGAEVCRQVNVCERGMYAKIKCEP
jgi:hypothetical protein